VAEGYINLEIFDENNVSIEQITFILPDNILPPQNSISEL